MYRSILSKALAAMTVTTLLAMLSNRQRNIGHTIKLRLLRCIAVACAVSACSAIEYSTQEMHTTIDGKTDVLEIELVYHNVEMGSDNSPASKGDRSAEQWKMRRNAPLRNAAKMLNQIATGRRRFMLGDPMFDIDLDRVAADYRTALGEFAPSTEIDLDRVAADYITASGEFAPSNEAIAAFITRALEFSAGVSMREASVYLDEQQLTIYQRLHIQNISKGTKLLNEYLGAYFLLEAEWWRDAVEDDATIALMRADVLAQYQWVSWTQSGLTLSIPVSPAMMAQVFKQGIQVIGELAEIRAKKGGGFESDHGELKYFTDDIWSLSQVLEPLLEPLSELTVHDNHLILVFASDADGSIRFNFPNGGPEKSGTDHKNDGKLLERLKEEGWELPSRWVATD